MRCYNCGWNNPDNVTKCQKCNQDLLLDSSFSTPSTEPAVPVQNAFSKTVLDTSMLLESEQPVQSLSCPKCGYPLFSGNKFCPNCGAEVISSSPVSNMDKTVCINPAYAKITSDQLKQTVLDSRASGKSPASQSYSGKLKPTIREFSPEIIHSIVAEEVINKTAPVQDIDTPSARLVPMDNFDGRSSRDVEIRGNMARISPSEAIDGLSFGTEAKLEFNFSDGCWTLVSDDNEKTVFVSTSNPVKIGKGDIIVIGNRRFRFE